MSGFWGLASMPTTKARRQEASVTATQACATRRCASWSAGPLSQTRSLNRRPRSPATVCPAPAGMVAATNRYCRCHVRLRHSLKPMDTLKHLLLCDGAVHLSTLLATSAGKEQVAGIIM